jgi:hypothetical protein
MWIYTSIPPYTNGVQLNYLSTGTTLPFTSPLRKIYDYSYVIYKWYHYIGCHLYGA